MAEKYTLTQGAAQWLVDKLKGSAQKQDVLTYEEIQASTDLSGKIASASSVREAVRTFGYAYQGTVKTITLTPNKPYLVIVGIANGSGYCGLYYVSFNKLIPIVSNNGKVTYDEGTRTLSLPSYYEGFVLELNR